MRTETHRHRASTIGHQLAGGVVDGRDVVGIEGMPHAQRVRGDTQPDPEDAALHREMRGSNQEKQHAPAENVQRDYCGTHSDDTAPLTLVQTMPRGENLHVCELKRPAYPCARAIACPR